MDIMDIKKVKQLADLMEERGLVKIEISDGEKKIMLEKENCSAGIPVSGAVASDALPSAQNLTSDAALSALASQNQSKPSIDGEELKSPLVGVAYLAPSPDAEPFVKVGSHVKKGQQLCILEAMKVMNEFISPRDGEIVEICVNDGDMVEFGQCVMKIK